jgi:hypothetical protein
MSAVVSTDALAERIVTIGREAGSLSQADLTRRLGRNYNATRIGEALDVVASRGLVGRRTVKSGGRGRPVTLWDFGTDYEVAVDPDEVHHESRMCACVRWRILDRDWSTGLRCFKCGRLVS